MCDFITQSITPFTREHYNKSSSSCVSLLATKSLVELQLVSPLNINFFLRNPSVMH